jgi:hypothetical protein
VSDKDDADAAYYENPENRRVRGPGHKLPGHPRLSSHTPIRFDAETIAAIRQFSDDDGMTVSAWVRRVVNREIQRRFSLLTRTATARPAEIGVQFEAGIARSTTVAASAVSLHLRIAS